MDWEKDTQTALKFIAGHPLRKEITALFKAGPPENRGWMFLSNESAAFRAIENKVLDLGYDSSGYAIMMRRIEAAIKTHGSTPWKDQLPPAVAKAKVPQVPIENEFTAPVSAKEPMVMDEAIHVNAKTCVMDEAIHVNAKTCVMDEANKTALQVLVTKGSAAAVKHMLFDKCNGDYSMMRSMYG